MASFNADVTLGSGVVSTNFVTGTRIWAGGTTTFDVGEELRSQAAATITGDSATVVVQGNPAGNGLWRHADVNDTGTFDFSNITIDMHGSGANASGYASLIFDNVTWVSTGLTGQATFGSWTALTATPPQTPPTYTINGLNVWFNVVGTDNNQATGVFFPGVIDGASTLNGISLWNGLTGDAALGAALTMRGQVFSGLQSGPIGFIPAGGVGVINPVLYLYRCESVPAGQTGLLLGYDYRGIHGQPGDFIFGADNGGHHWIINPLQGDNTGTLRFGNVFNSGTASNIVVAVGNRPASTAGDVKIVNESHGTNNLYTVPAALTNTAIPTIITGGIAELSAIPNGIVISNQLATNAAVNALSPTAVTNVTDKTYRTYSWQHDDWGTNVRSITPPAASGITPASEASILALRDSGAYPDMDNTGFLTPLDISEAEDNITAGFPTIAAARTTLHAVGGATNPRDVLASLKAAHYDGITTTHLNLPYTVTGASASIPFDVTFSTTAAAAPAIAGARTIPSSGLSASTVEDINTLTVSSLIVNGNYTLDAVNIVSNGTAVFNNDLTSTNNSEVTTTGTGDHITVTGKATGGTLTSGAQVILDGDSENVVGDADGHFTFNGTGHTHENLRALTTGGLADIRILGGGTKTFTGTCDFDAPRNIVLPNSTIEAGDYNAGTDINITSTNISGGSFDAGNDIDLTGATISGGNFEATDDIDLEDATITGGTFITADATNADILVRDASINDAHLIARTIGLIGAGVFGSGNTIGVAGRNTDLRMNFSGTPTMTVPQILGTDYEIEADTITWSNGPGTVTITVTRDDLDNITIIDPGTGLEITPGTTTAASNGVIFNYPVSSDTTFTTDPSPDGGNFVVFTRTLPTDSWVAGTPVAVAADTAGSISINNAVGEYLAVWKPSNSTTYTSFRHEVFATISVTDPPPFNVSTTNIPTEILSTTTVPTNVLDGTTNSIWSMPATGVFDGQLLLEIVNATGVLDVVGPPASSSTPRLDGGQTQTLLRSGLATQAYFNFIVENTNNLVPIDVTEFDTSVNFIRALTPTSTRVNGDYLELNTKDGTQQKITAVENTSATPITGKISATIDATTTTDLPGTPTTSIEFDAVDIADNPMGITLAEVRNAVKVLTDDLSTEHATLSRNQQANQVAIQRGAVKAATYSADDIDIIIT